MRIEEPGVVDHEAEGWVRMGARRGRRRARGPRTSIVAGSWDVILSDDIVRDQWHKLLWNAGFNAICAVTGATAGEALATPGLGAAGAGGDGGGGGGRGGATASP